MNTHQASQWIEKLGLLPHPEGGFYRSTFASEEKTTDKGLTVNFEGTRKLYTSIYFLLTSDNISHFHRLKSDEVWYYHAGSSLTIHVIEKDGTYREIQLGMDLDNGDVPQALVPKGAIFGSSVKEEDACSLVGCMVSPGFEFQDFELFTQAELLEKYPQHEEIIRKLAYEKLP